MTYATYAIKAQATHDQAFGRFLRGSVGGALFLSAALAIWVAWILI
jgi:hypothetical protein